MAEESFTEYNQKKQDHAAWLMWHGAVIPLMKKPPPLESFLSKKGMQDNTENAIINQLRAYQARRDQNKQDAAKAEK